MAVSLQQTVPALGLEGETCFLSPRLGGGRAGQLELIGWKEARGTFGGYLCLGKGQSWGEKAGGPLKVRGHPTNCKDKP